MADHLFDGAVNGLERDLGALLGALDFSDIAFNRGDGGSRLRARGGRWLGAAQQLHMGEQVGDAALDRGHSAEPRIRCIKPADQLSDSLLQALERRRIGRAPNRFELLHGVKQKPFEAARRGDLGGCIDRIGERVDAAAERRNRLPGSGWRCGAALRVWVVPALEVAQPARRTRRPWVLSAVFMFIFLWYLWSLS